MFEHNNERTVDKKELPKHLKQDSRGYVYVKDLTEIEIKSMNDVVKLVNHLNSRRLVSYSYYNLDTSSSHIIYTVKLVQLMRQSTSSTLPKICVNQLAFVDLASDEHYKSNFHQSTVKSTSYNSSCINSSLMGLRNCLETLKENFANKINQVIFLFSYSSRFYFLLLF